MIKAIIFDMDGVLVDAKEWHFEALNRALKLFGFRISEFEHETRFDGLPTRAKLKMLARENGFPAGLASFVNEMKQKFLLEVAQQLCHANPSHVTTLERLQNDGYQLAVASNSIRRSVDSLMQLTELEAFFSFTLSNEDVCEPKPNSEIYDRAIQRLGVTPTEVLVVEDGHYGIQAAKAAGAHVLPVAGVHEVNCENIYSRIASLDHQIRKAA